MFNKDKVSIPNIIVQTFKGMKDILSQGKIFLYYSIFLSIINGFLGQWLYSCVDHSDNWWCIIPKGNIYYLSGLFGFYILLCLFILFSFYFDLYKSIFSDNKFILKDIFNFSKEKLRFAGFVYLFCFLIIAFIAIALKISTKEPNPDWRIEFLYFIVFFVFAFLPIVFIRMSSSIDYMADFNKIPFKKIWNMTSKRTFSLVVTFCLIFLFINFIHIRLSYSLRTTASEYNYFIVAFIVDMIGCFLLFNYIAFLMMYFRAVRSLIDEKYEILQGDKEEEKIEPTEEAVEIIEKQPKKGKKNKAKKKK